MVTGDAIDVARHLEGMGINIVRDGFAAWIRQDLGFAASDEHVDRALLRVHDVVRRGRPATMFDLTATIAAEMPAAARIDAFGGSAWTMD